MVWIEPKGLPERLAQVQKKFGLRNSQLADHGAVTGQTIKNILDGKTSNPSPEIFVKISKALGVSAKWLLTGDGRMEDFDSVTRSLESQDFAEAVVSRLEKYFQSGEAFYQAQLKQRDADINWLRAKVDKLEAQLEQVGKLESSQDATGQVFQHPALQKGEEMERLAA